MHEQATGMRVRSGQVSALLRSPYLWTAIALLFKTAYVRWLVVGDTNVLHAFVLETGFLLLLLLPAEALSDRPFVWHALADAVTSAALVAVVMYFQYSARVVTPEAVGMLGQVGEVKGSVAALFDPIVLLFFADVLLIPLLCVARRGPLSAEPLDWHVVGRLGVASIAMSVGVLGWSMSANIASSREAARHQGLIAFELKHMLETQRANAVSADVSDVADLRARIAELKGDPLSGPDTPQHFGEAKGKNVVFILAESLQSFVVGLKVNGESVTPNLDRLLAEGYYFPRVVQQVSAGGTSDAEFIANTSVYPLESVPVSKVHAKRDIPSLPRVLRANGYRAITLHANDVRFWNRDELYPALGFEKAYDDSAFADATRVLMGPCDEDVLRTSADIIADERARAGKPVYASIVTLTSHHPFDLPEAYRRLELPADIDGTLAGDYLQSMAYLDRAVGALLDRLDERGLADDTVVVVQGDHFGLQKDRLGTSDLRALHRLLGHDYTVTERFTVPLFVRIPGSASHVVDETLGQVDTMPTLLNLLGLSAGDQVMFGHDALNAQSNLVGVRYYMPTGAFATNDVLVEPKRGLKDATVYDLRTGQATGRASAYGAQHSAVLQLEALSDAYLKGLPVRAAR